MLNFQFDRAPFQSNLEPARLNSSPISKEGRYRPTVGRSKQGLEELAYSPRPLLLKEEIEQLLTKSLHQRRAVGDGMELSVSRPVGDITEMNKLCRVVTVPASSDDSVVQYIHDSLLLYAAVCHTNMLSPDGKQTA